MKIADWINRGLMAIGGAALLALTFQVGVGAVSRSLFHTPIYGTIEIASHYYMVAIALLPLGAVQVVKGHVIVEVFTQALRRSWRGKLDLFAAVLTTVYLAVLGWGCLDGAISAFKAGEYTHLYAFDLTIWPARWLLVVGIIGFLATLIGQLITRNYHAEEADDDHETDPYHLHEGGR